MCAVVPRGTCVCILCAPRHACSHVLTDAIASLWSHWSLETLVPFLPNTGLGLWRLNQGCEGRTWEEAGLCPGAGRGCDDPMSSVVSSRPPRVAPHSQVGGSGVRGQGGVARSLLSVERVT